MTKKVVRRSGAKPKAVKKAKVQSPSSNSRKLDAKALKTKYPQMIAGTLEFDASRGKQTVEIKCAGGPNAKTCRNPKRRVATSDLFQVTRCGEHTLETRRASRSKARAKA